MKTKKLCEEKEFKGNAVLEFSDGEEDNYPFSLGVSKLATIVEHLDEVYQFLKNNNVI